MKLPESPTPRQASTGDDLDHGGNRDDREVQGALDTAAAMLAHARNVWIGTHMDPDGDAIGSLIGLGRLLRDQGIAVTLACQDQAPEDFQFLVAGEVITSAGPTDHDLAVAVDAGDLERLGTLVDAASWAGQPTLVMDHHRSNPGFGDVNVVMPWVSSTCEIVLDLAERMGLVVSVDVATALLAGLLADTMAFRTTNTSADTMRRAASLVDRGAQQSDLIDRVFGSRPLAMVRLHGRAIERLEVRGRIGVATLTLADLDELGASSEDSKGISSFLISARELVAVALVRERDGESCDVSMRSRSGTDVIPVAQRLGGGGHPQAAGAKLPSPMATATAAVWSALLSEIDGL